MAAPGDSSRPAARGLGASEAGFSLIEALAALVATMLLMLALTPFAGQMLATWSRGVESVRRIELMTRGMCALRNDVRRAAPALSQGFRGDETSLSFLAAGPENGVHGLLRISIEAAPSADGWALVRRRAALSGDAPGAFADPVTLISGPFAYRFRYYSRQGEELTAWDKPNEPPARIELSIHGENMPVFKTPLAFSVPASISAACLLDLNLPGCPATPPQEEDIQRWMQDFGYTGDG